VAVMATNKLSLLTSLLHCVVGNGISLAAQDNTVMTHQTTVATILEFPTRAESWIPPHARQCTADDIEFHTPRLLQHLAP
jgi:hypothetical protein